MPLPTVPRTRDRRRPRPRSLAPAWLATALVLAACSGTPTPTGAGSAAPSAAAPSAESGQPGPSGSTPGSTNPPLPTGPDRLAVSLVTDGLVSPVAIANAGDGSRRLFVAERGGRIRVLEANGDLRPEPFGDLSGRVLSGGERGLLGIAFHPDFAANGRLFVYYTRTDDGASVLSELRADPGRASADQTPERVLLVQAQPFANHNGGQLAFGPDGYLYLGLGDGGSGGDPYGNAQNTGVLLGKILRLDVDGPPVDGRAYAIPTGNPFAPGGIRPGAGLDEIWAYGLRNPWRFSFDPEGGDLYIGDVGQNSWEEIDRQPGDSAGGENYGWAEMEGRHCYRDGCDQSPYGKPIAEYSHHLGCSVTGGHVYRGREQPALVGVYVFGDYCSGTLFTLQVDEGTITPKPVAQTGLNISTFGTGEDGEIYLADVRGGAIYRVEVAG